MSGSAERTSVVEAHATEGNAPSIDGVVTREAILIYVASADGAAFVDETTKERIDSSPTPSAAPLDTDAQQTDDAVYVEPGKKRTERMQGTVSKIQLALDDGFQWKSKGKNKERDGKAARKTGRNDKTCSYYRQQESAKLNKARRAAKRSRRRANHLASLVQRLAYTRELAPNLTAFHSIQEEYDHLLSRLENALQVASIRTARYLNLAARLDGTAGTNQRCAGHYPSKLGRLSREGAVDACSSTANQLRGIPLALVAFEASLAASTEVFAGDDEYDFAVRDFVTSIGTTITKKHLFSEENTVELHNLVDAVDRWHSADDAQRKLLLAATERALLHALTSTVPRQQTVRWVTRALRVGKSLNEIKHTYRVDSSTILRIARADGDVKLQNYHRLDETHQSAIDEWLEQDPDASALSISQALKADGAAPSDWTIRQYVARRKRERAASAETHTTVTA